MVSCNNDNNTIRKESLTKSYALCKEFNDFQCMINLRHELLSLEPNQYHHLDTILGLYLQMDNFNSGERLGQYLLDVRENSFRMTKTGYCYLRNGKHETAISLFQKALESNPDSLILKYFLATSLLKALKPDPAIALLTEIMKDTASGKLVFPVATGSSTQRVSAYAAALNAIAVAELQSGRPNMAIKALVGALEAEPGFISARNNLNTIENAK